MKRIILSTLILLTVSGLAHAGTISGTGMSQKDLASLLSSIVTKHNALFADYTGLKKRMRNAENFTNYSAVSKRVGAAPSAGGLSLTQ